MTHTIKCDVCKKLADWPPKNQLCKTLDEGYYTYTLDWHPGFLKGEQQTCRDCGNKIRDFVKSLTQSENRQT